MAAGISVISIRMVRRSGLTEWVAGWVIGLSHGEPTCQHSQSNHHRDFGQHRHLLLPFCPRSGTPSRAKYPPLVCQDNLRVDTRKKNTTDLWCSWNRYSLATARAEGFLNSVLSYAKWLKALFASAMRWTSSRLLMALPSPRAALKISSARRSAMGRPFSERAAWMIQRKASAC